MSRPVRESARVISVAAGPEATDRAAPVRDRRHEALAVLIGKMGPPPTLTMIHEFASWTMFGPSPPLITTSPPRTSE